MIGRPSSLGPRPGARFPAGLGLAPAALATLLLCAVPVAGASLRPPPRRDPPRPAAGEALRLRIVNRYFGAISVSRDRGTTWSRVGRVLRPLPGRVHVIGPREFTASDWAPVGAVAASAVNALHLKVAQGDEHAVIFSLLPAELAERDPSGSYRDAGASILTDVPAGSTIFGDVAPRVGDGLFLEDGASRDLSPWPAGRAPGIGDRLVLVVADGSAAGAEGRLEIENAWGGEVHWEAAGSRHRVGRVFRPLSGSGRFGGTAYQEPGRVRANHPGVLCVSTSPRGETGGFQIVPSFHAGDPSLGYVATTSAYLVVGPAGADDPGLEGRFPLYLGCFRPGDRVEARIAGRWGPFPEAAGLKASAFAGVEAIRIRAGD